MGIPRIAQVERLLEQTWEWVCTVSAWLHRFFAWVLGGGIGGCWRVQTRLPLGLKFFVGFGILAAMALALSWFIPWRYVEWAHWGPDRVRLLELNRVWGFEKAGAIRNALPFLRGDVAEAAPEEVAEVAPEKVDDTWIPWGAEQLAKPAEDTQKKAAVVAPAGQRTAGGATLRGLWRFAGTPRGMIALAAALCGLAAFAAFVRCRLSLWIMKAAWAAWLLVWFSCMYWGITAPAVLTRIDYKMFPKDLRNELWTMTFTTGFLLLVIPLLVLLGLVLSSTRRHYCRTAKTEADASPSYGDGVLDSLRTGGDDPRYRSSIYWSVGLWLTVLALPFIMRGGCGTEKGYDMVLGDEDFQVEVTVKKPKPKQKKLLVNAWSPYILTAINIDDSGVMSEMSQMTKDTYAATTGEGASGSGKGGRGRFGVPNGMEGASVRFIRLQYSGGSWDEGMGRGGDYNMLLWFNQTTKVPIASETESRDISRLDKFPPKKAPPFVYMTGRGGISLSESEVRTLRKYLRDEGGMLFIDCGGGHFAGNVRQMLNRVFPGQPLTDISNDDPIFQAPFSFSEGAPPLWHHDGFRARGIKIDGRWAVFYHPGNMKGAWRDGHSGAKKDVVDQAYMLGVNVMYYSFNQYYRRHYGTGSE